MRCSTAADTSLACLIPLAAIAIRSKGARTDTMVFLTWREVDFGSVVLAGIASGYVMAIAGLWAGRVPGLVAVDISDFGRRYMVSDRPSAWLLGFFSHLTNSVLLVLVWACLVEPNLDWYRPLEGLLWGEIMAVTLAGSMIAPLSGMGFMGRKTGSPRFAFTSVILHGIWGVTLGIIYVPR